MLARRSFIAVLMAQAGLAACSPPATPATPRSPDVKTDLQQLARLVRLPAPAVKAQWETAPLAHSSAPGPEDWQLWAVMDIGAAARQQLLEASPAQTGAEWQFPASLSRPWFPDALKARLETQADGSVRLRDAPRDAAAFHSPPLLQGFWLPFGDGGELLLVLQTR